jgi:hypothetical protein
VRRKTAGVDKADGGLLGVGKARKQAAVGGSFQRGKFVKFARKGYHYNSPAYGRSGPPVLMVKY